MNTKPMILSEKIDFFGPDAMPSLVEVASFHVFRPNQVLFYAEHFPYGLFFLIDGIVQIDYLVKTVEEIRESAILGTAAFFGNTVYYGTARAITACKVYFLSKNAYLGLSDTHPEIYQWLKQQLVGNAN